MASFFLTSSSQIARTLLAGESGFIAANATLFVPAANAVVMTGSASLAVYGTLASDLDDALRIDSTAPVADIAIGAQGSMVSLKDAAIRGTVNDRFQLSNAGTISGGNEAIFLAATTVSGLVADYHITNSGAILSTGSTTGTSVLRFDQYAGATTDIANTGIIANSGVGGVISLTGGGRLDLTNSGTIQCRTVSNAISTSTANDIIDNAGTIIGNIFLSDGNDTVTNHATIRGNLTFGNGSDRLVNTGTITGAVTLSDVPTTGAIADTVINAGLIIGDVNLGNGNDIFRSRGGVVDGTVFGGAGNDLYIVDRSDLVLSETSGEDTVRASVDFALVSGIERLEITGAVGRTGTGNETANTLVGSIGDDRLRGLGGNDSLNDGAGDGDDLLAGGQGDDLLVSTGGNDTLFGGAGFDTAFLRFFVVGDAWVVDLAAGTAEVAGVRSVTLGGVEAVEGDFGNDSLTGNAAANRLIGGFGSDLLSGGGGADTLVGATGVDTLVGGTGADLFQFTIFDDSSPFEVDLIKDFTQGADRIDLPDAASYVFVGTGPFTGTADEVRFFTDVGANTTTVLVRLLGTATNAMEITLSGIFTLTAADFLF